MSTNPSLSVVPYLTVEDTKAEIAFLIAAFGAEQIALHPTPDGEGVFHAEVRLFGATVFVSDDCPEMNGGKARTARALGGTPVMISLIVPRCDEVWARATAAGATVILPLADQAWGDRFGMIEDPAGNRWSISTPKA